MELGLPLELFTRWQATCRTVFGICGFFQTMHEGVSAPSCCGFFHRVAFQEVSGHRVLIKSGPGNRGLSACVTTHEATSQIFSLDRPHPEVRREGWEPLPDKARESTLQSQSGGEKWLRWSRTGNLGVPLESKKTHVFVSPYLWLISLLPKKIWDSW